MSIYYTTAPLPDPNDNLAGVVVMSVILAVYFVAVLLPAFHSRPWWNSPPAHDIRPWPPASLTTKVIVHVLFWVMLSTSIYRLLFVEYPRPLNEPVIATLINEHTFSDNDGPKGRRQDHSRVVYLLPEGEIAYARAVGVLYPEQALLYRQTRSRSP